MHFVGDFFSRVSTVCDLLNILFYNRIMPPFVCVVKKNGAKFSFFYKEKCISIWNYTVHSGEKFDYIPICSHLCKLNSWHEFQCLWKTMNEKHIQVVDYAKILVIMEIICVCWALCWYYLCWFRKRAYSLHWWNL